MQGSGSPYDYIRPFVAVISCLVVAGAVVAVDLVVVLGIEYLTGAIPFGICGPNGSQIWVVVMFILLLAGPVVRIHLGFVVAKRFARGHSTPSIDPVR
jgi:hypothetical protein